ncbi:MAG: 3-phosphoserine/phosphohydroxythreonine transaminase [Planctomycetota bacterium]|nr:MAG: 3-phosphoserine/phosphohydroxythreonine transaminase [Planctomycetota bacterium]REJ96855.1 MAG: 3-phosphoserine/phosphohydroxythreonine transaminase [Planctomycetota bacterium]REK24044.1 MAG: 3-phosphoserine/phosphohydroxythreonine transaminase [Planctomycetota bacterium]
MTERVYNFSPGPAVLPEDVLRRAQSELLALPDVGISVLEISHRSAAFGEILAAAKANLRRLYGLPENYHVIFLQGGSRLQFSMVPMNLLDGRTGEYLVTGSWGKKAVAEAKREGPTRVVWDGGETNYDRLPASDACEVSPEAAYLHFTSNETIQGVQFPVEPASGEVPLVCDASSDFISRPIDVARYGLIYACAQKNAGPAGVTVVIVRDDLLARCPDNQAGMLDYRNHVKEDSCYNTPPVFGIYVVKLVTDWLLESAGSLEEMARRNRAKAALLYDVIDAHSDFYLGHAQPACRSAMNVTFRLAREELQPEFLAAAAARKLVELKGHRSVGGFRASIYNAMPTAGVKALADVMREFAAQHGG